MPYLPGWSCAAFVDRFQPAVASRCSFSNNTEYLNEARGKLAKEAAQMGIPFLPKFLGTDPVPPEFEGIYLQGWVELDCTKEQALDLTDVLDPYFPDGVEYLQLRVLVDNEEIYRKGKG